MRVSIDGTIHEGTGTEILEQLRQESFEECPDTGAYLQQLRENFIRATGLECVLPASGLERQAETMFALLAKAGALEVLDG